MNSSTFERTLNVYANCYIPIIMNNFSRSILILFMVSFTGIHDETCQRGKLHDLLNYLVHILKQELDVNDLKEKAVIHSKSINEHFSESLIKDLMSLININDYSQLDVCLVLLSSEIWDN